MSTEHRRPLFAFVAVFVVAMLVMAGAARSDAFRDLVRERTVDIVAATTLDLVGEPEPRQVVAPQADAPGEVVGSPAGQPGRTGKANGHDDAKAPGKAKGHQRSGHPGKAQGHQRSGHPGKAQGHQGSGHPGKAKGHDKSRGKSKGKHGR